MDDCDSHGLTQARAGVAGFVRVRMDSIGHVLGSSGSCEFTWERLGVIGFIPVRVGSLGKSSGSFRYVWVHSGATRSRLGVTLERLRVVGFIMGSVISLTHVYGIVECIYDHLGSLRRAEEASGSVVFAWVCSGAPNRRGIHSSSLGFTQ